MSISIKDAPLVEKVKEEIKIPISDGSGTPKSINISQIKNFSNKEVITTIKELEDRIKALEENNADGLFTLVKDETTQEYYIHTKYSLASEGAVSSLGIGAGNGGDVDIVTGTEYLYLLKDIKSVNNLVVGAVEGYSLVYKNGLWQGAKVEADLSEIELDITEINTSLTNLNTKLGPIEDAYNKIKTWFTLLEDKQTLVTEYNLASKYTVSSLGISTEGDEPSVGGANALYQLYDVLRDGDAVAGASEGNSLVYKDGKWQGVMVKADLSEIERTISDIETALNNHDKAINANKKSIDTLSEQVSDIKDAYDIIKTWFTVSEDGQTLITDYNLASKYTVSSLGIGEGGSTGGSGFSILQSWEDDSDSSEVMALGSNLGRELYADISVIKNENLKGISSRVEAVESGLDSANRTLTTHNTNIQSNSQSIAGINERITPIENAFNEIKTWFRLEGGVLRTTHSLASDQTVSSLGVGSDNGGSGVSYDRLDNWDNYVEGDGSVLSSDLGYGLLVRIINLEESTSGDYASIEEKVNKNTNAITNLSTSLNDFLTGVDVDDTINRWKELEKFLEGYTETATLADLLKGKVDTEAYNTAINGVNETLGIHTTAINSNAASIASINTTLLNHNTRITDNANAINEIEKTLADWFTLENGVLHSKYGLASDKTVSSLGVGSSEGGGVSYNRLDSWDSYTDDKAGYVLSAALGYDLKTRLDNLDLGDFDLSGYLTKGEAQNTYATIIALNGKQNAITANNKLSASLVSGLSTVATSGKYGDLSGLPTFGSLAFKDSLTASDIPSLSWNKITSDKPTTLSGYGITDGVLARAIELTNSDYTSLQDWADNSPSFVGSFYDKTTWYNVISIRHRNGASDGNKYGMLLYSLMTRGGSLKYVKNYGGNWDGEVTTLLDSYNFYSYALPLTGGEISGNLTVGEWLAVQDVIYAHKGLEVSKTIKGIAENDDETWSINGDTGAAAFDSIKVGSSPSIYKADNNALVVAKSGVTYKTSTKGNTLQVISQGAVGIDWSTAIIAFGGEAYNVVGSGVGLSLGGYVKGSYANAPIGRGVGIAAVSESTWYNVTGLAFFTNNGTSDSADQFTEKIRLTAYGSLIPKYNTSQVLGNSDNRWSYVYSVNGDFSGSVTIGDAKIWWDATNKVLRTNVSFASDKTVSSLGVGSESGGGGTGGYASLDNVASDVLPSASNTFTIGNSSRLWKAVYANSLYLGTTNVGESISSLQSALSTANGNIGTLNTRVTNIEGGYAKKATTLSGYGITDALPLSGGMISGTGADVLIVNRTDGNNSVITFDNNGTFLGRLGYSTKNTPIVQIDGEYKDIIHSGNIGSQSVSYANSAGNADTLGGLYYNSFYQVQKETIPSTGDISAIEAGSYWVYKNKGEINPVPSTYSSLIAFGKSYYSPQLCVTHNASNAWLRGIYNTPSGYSASDWHELAFTDSNVASADKLSTARTIWGQSFDGSGNVDGNIKITSGGLYLDSDRYVWGKDKSNNTLSLIGMGTSDTLNIGWGSANASHATYLFGKGITMYYNTSNIGFVLNSSGNVTIGSSDLATANYKLYVNGNAAIIEGVLTDRVHISQSSDIARGIATSYTDTSNDSNGIARPWYGLSFVSGNTYEQTYLSGYFGMTFRTGGTPYYFVYQGGGIRPWNDGTQNCGTIGFRWNNVVAVNGNYSGNMLISGGTTIGSTNELTGNTYKLYVNGNSYVNGELTSNSKIYTPYLFLGKDAEGIYVADNVIAWHNASNVWTKTIIDFSGGNVKIAQATTIDKTLTVSSVIEANKGINIYGTLTGYVSGTDSDTWSITDQGTASFSDTLTVQGKAELQSGIDVIGLIQGLDSVGGDTTWKITSDGSVTVKNIKVGSNERIHGGGNNFYIGNASNAGWVGMQDICSQDALGDSKWSIRTDGRASFGSTLKVAGATTLSSTLGVTGVATFNSNIKAKGYIYFGANDEAWIYWDAGKKVLRTNVSFASDKTVSSLGVGTDEGGGGGSADWGAVPTSIIPTVNGEYNLGSNAKMWNALYVQSGYFGGIMATANDITIQKPMLGSGSTWQIATNGAASFSSLSVGGSAINFGNFALKASLGTAASKNWSGAAATDSSNLVTADWVSNKLANLNIPDTSSFAKATDLQNYFPLAGNKIITGKVTISSTGSLEVQGNVYVGGTLYSGLHTNNPYATQSWVNNALKNVSANFNGGTVTNATTFNDNVVIKGENGGYRMRTLSPTIIDFSYGQDYIILRGYSGANETWIIDSENGSADFNDYVAASSFEQSSDINLKNILADVRLSLAMMACAPLVRFDWKNKVNKKHHVGTIAQYWEDALPEVVTTTHNDTLALAYGELGVAMGISLANYLTETNDEVSKLKKRVEELESENKRLQERVDALVA